MWQMYISLDRWRMYCTQIHGHIWTPLHWQASLTRRYIGCLNCCPPIFTTFSYINTSTVSLSLNFSYWLLRLPNKDKLLSAICYFYAVTLCHSHNLSKHLKLFKWWFCVVYLLFPSPFRICMFVFCVSIFFLLFFGFPFSSIFFINILSTKKRIEIGVHPGNHCIIQPYTHIFVEKWFWNFSTMGKTFHSIQFFSIPIY